MRHVVFLVKKRPDMSQREFTDYWINEHAPLTASVQGVVGYRCYPALPDEAHSPFDAVAVLSFSDDAAYEAAMESEDFAAALADATNFQDTEVTVGFEADERIIV